MADRPPEGAPGSSDDDETAKLELPSLRLPKLRRRRGATPSPEPTPDATPDSTPYSAPESPSESLTATEPAPAPSPEPEVQQPADGQAGDLIGDQGPWTTEEPVEQPAYEQPAYEQPAAYEQPQDEQPAFQQPAYQQPAYEEPASFDQAAEHPAPAYDETAAQPEPAALDEPAYEQPAYEQPATDDATSQQPGYDGAVADGQPETTAVLATEADPEAEQPRTAPRVRRDLRLPPLPGPVASAVTGVVVGVFGVLATYVSLRGCDIVRGANTCGGTGLLLLLVILVLMVLLGGLLLSRWNVPEPRSTSFLAVGVLSVVVMLTLMQQLYSGWMFALVPILAIPSYLVSYWVTTTFVEPTPQRGPQHDVR